MTLKHILGTVTTHRLIFITDETIFTTVIPVHKKQTCRVVMQIDLYMEISLCIGPCSSGLANGGQLVHQSLCIHVQI